MPVHLSLCSIVLSYYFTHLATQPTGDLVINLTVAAVAFCQCQTPGYHPSRRVSLLFDRYQIVLLSGIGTFLHDCAHIAQNRLTVKNPMKTQWSTWLRNSADACSKDVIHVTGCWCWTFTLSLASRHWTLEILPNCGSDWLSICYFSC